MTAYFNGEVTFTAKILKLLKNQMEKFDEKKINSLLEGNLAFDIPHFRAQPLLLFSSSVAIY